MDLVHIDTAGPYPAPLGGSRRTGPLKVPSGPDMRHDWEFRSYSRMFASRRLEAVLTLKGQVYGLNRSSGAANVSIGRHCRLMTGGFLPMRYFPGVARRYHCCPFPIPLFIACLGSRRRNTGLGFATSLILATTTDVAVTSYWTRRRGKSCTLVTWHPPEILWITPMRIPPTDPPGEAPATPSAPAAITVTLLVPSFPEQPTPTATSSKPLPLSPCVSDASWEHEGYEEMPGNLVLCVTHHESFRIAVACHQWQIMQLSCRCWLLVNRMMRPSANLTHPAVFPWSTGHLKRMFDDIR